MLTCALVAGVSYLSYPPLRGNRRGRAGSEECEANGASDDGEQARGAGAGDAVRLQLNSLDSRLRELRYRLAVGAVHGVGTDRVSGGEPARQSSTRIRATAWKNAPGDRLGRRLEACRPELGRVGVVGGEVLRAENGVSGGQGALLDVGIRAALSSVLTLPSCSLSGSHCDGQGQRGECKRSDDGGQLHAERRDVGRWCGGLARKHETMKSLVL